MDRIERDSLGEVRVDAARHWGAQTQRSLENFPIGTETMPVPVLRAFAALKMAAARANFRLGVLREDRCRAIEAACGALLTGEYDGVYSRKTLSGKGLASS